MKLATRHLDNHPPRVAQTDSHLKNDWLELTLALLIGFASLLAFSLLLPDGLAQVVQEVLGWCLAGAMLGLALLAAIKGLHGLLET